MSAPAPVHLAHLLSDEISFLGGLSHALSFDDAKIDTLWLRIGPGYRLWIVDAPEFRLTHRFEVTHEDDIDPPTHIQRWFALPERILRIATADQRGPNTELLLVDGTTALVRCEHTSAAIDLMPHLDEPISTSWGAHTDAVTPLGRLAGVIWAADAFPNDRLRTAYPFPPMWLQLDGSEIIVHLDWNDLATGRATYRCNASITGPKVLVPARPHLLAPILHHMVYLIEGERQADVRLRVGEVEFDGPGLENRDAIEMRIGPMAITMWIHEPLVERWGAEVVKAIEATGAELIGSVGAEWNLLLLGVEARVTAHHGHPDHIRVASVLGRYITETLEVLREINALNVASKSTRFWLADNTIWAAADVRCSDRPLLALALSQAIDDVVNQTRRYAPLMAALTSA